MRATIYVGLFVCGAVFGQPAPSAIPEFEVASVKPAAQQSGGQPNMIMRGGPGSLDPEQIIYTNLPLMPILTTAYGVKNYRISGPAWLDSERFDIRAKVPSGATKEQFNQMLQHLLADRFKMTLHHEAREFQIFELVVGRNGLKMRESAETGRAGTMTSGTQNGQTRLTAKMQTLSTLAGMLESRLNRPVLDKTGLTGRYDFTLQYGRDSVGAPAFDTQTEAGPSLFTALQEQLGLRLESKKAPLDVLVIDHVEKIPTEN